MFIEFYLPDYFPCTARALCLPGQQHYDDGEKGKQMQSVIERWKFFVAHYVSYSST